MEQSRDEGFWTAPDGISLFYRYYPGSKSDQLIAVIHGFAEHSGRYTKLAETFQGAGRSVLTFDLRGHGRSGGARGLVEFWEQYWDDFRGLTKFVQSQLQGPMTQMIVLGHSLGGLIALEGASRNAEGIEGLILSSPCLGIPLAPGLKVLNSLLTAVSPSFSYANPVKPANLSHDEAACQTYVDDSLVLKNIRAKTLHAIIRAGDLLEKSAPKLCMPVWFLAAGDERIVDLKRTLRIYAKMDAPFKKLKIFDAFRHEIFNEVRSEIAYDTALQAIEQIVEFNLKSGRKHF